MVGLTRGTMEIGGGKKKTRIPIAEKDFSTEKKTIK